LIKVDLTKCTGCRRCETACAFFHTGKINHHLSRIKVLNLYETGIDGPVVCKQCQQRYCLRCPVNALAIGSLGQLIVSPTVCTLCGACEKNCPIGAIEIFDEIVYVCDFCGGRPKCVEACTEQAIVFDENEERPSLAEIKAETKKMYPSQKRQFYLNKLGTAVRKQWRKENA
jgi:carbon-monoxide dehydrogenase iron sulfur subunit